MEKGKDFIAYSLAVDQSTDTTDIAQLSIFIRGVDSSLSITEEFLALRPIHGTTTGQTLYEGVSRCVNGAALGKTREIDNRWSTRDVWTHEWIGGKDT